MNKTPTLKAPLQTEPRFHLCRYEQPHTIGGPAKQQKADGRLVVARSSSSDNDPRSGCTAKPVPRLEATLRMTQQCQPGATVNTTKNGPTVMAVAGGRKQRSRRQPSLRPIQGQQGNPLPRREDGAPGFRSSNDSRTRNGCPANHSPRRINSAAGQAAPLAGEASDASPSP
jgi:hypothetical protein